MKLFLTLVCLVAIGLPWPPAVATPQVDKNEITERSTKMVLGGAAAIQQPTSDNYSDRRVPVTGLDSQLGEVIFTDNTVREAAQAFGFQTAQANTLDRIEREIPELASSVRLARLAFSKAFGESIRFMDATMTNRYASWARLKRVASRAVSTNLDAQRLTLNSAKGFIDTVHKRAKGDIPSPILETLLIFNPTYLSTPESEIFGGFKARYTSNGSEKSRGVAFHLDYPRSWSSEEGNRPHIVRRLVSQSGRGLEVITIQITPLNMLVGNESTFVDLEKRAASLFNPELLSRTVPEGATILDGGPIQLDGKAGYYQRYSSRTLQVDKFVSMLSVSYTVPFDSTLIQITCNVGGIDVDPSSLQRHFEKFSQLFRLVANSLVIESQWLSDNPVAESPMVESASASTLRERAEQGDAEAQFKLGLLYGDGIGVPKNELEAIKWHRKAAEQGFARAQVTLGNHYAEGRGVPKDSSEKVRWYQKAAEQGEVTAQFLLALTYSGGLGVPKDEVVAAKWCIMAANQGYESAQFMLGLAYAKGRGVKKDESEAYKWLILAGAQGNDVAKQELAKLDQLLTPAQKIQGRRAADGFRPETSFANRGAAPNANVQVEPKLIGSGFFITADGYFITNQHVTGEGATVRVLTAAGTIPARVVKVDQANDLALLKAEGKFTALPVITSRGARLGATVATVGFPNTGLQGFAPKLAKGEIASLAGAQDDARHFQISAPIQPGNSGGALVDERGNVIGVVVAKLSQQAALASSGTLAENVNYAVKSSYLLSFLESVPAVAAQLKEPNTQSRPFEDVVRGVEQATVLVLVY